MNTRVTELAKGAVALAGLLAAIIGIPGTLSKLGQGPPTSWPTSRALAGWAAHPITDDAMVRTVAVLCWAVWALFVVAVAVELVAHVGSRADRRGRPPAALGRVLRIPGLQGIAATCVLTALLLLPQRPPPVDRAGVARPPVAIPLVAPGVEPAVARRRGHVTPVGWRRYIVERYDSPWSIAERHLGNGAKWRELRDDEGRPLWAPDSGKGPDLSGWIRGARAGPGVRARIIHPGDVLFIPGPPEAPTPGHISPAAPVRPAARVAPAAPAPPVDPPAPPDPPAPAALAKPAAPAVPAPAAGQEHPTPSPPIVAMVDHGASGQSTPGLPLVLLEGGLLSASVLGMVELLRRRQRQHRPSGRRIRLPAGDLARSEVGLRIGQRRELAQRIEWAMAMLMASWPGSTEPPPAIVGVVADEHGVELLLADPVPARPPWLTAAEGFRWRLAGEHVGPSGELSSAPIPALAPIGRAAGSGADVLVNLEAAGVLAVKGDPRRAGGIIRAMTTSLCGSPWATAIDLVLVGFGEELVAAPQVRTVDSLAAVVAELRSTARVTAQLLASHGCRDTWEGRARRLAGDGWPPTVVMCSAPPADAELAELVSLATPGHGVAAVIPTVSALGWTLDADRVPMVISPLRLAVEPTVLAAGELAAVGQLLAVADQTDGATLADPPYHRIQLSSERPATESDGDQPSPTVLVRVLGPLEIDGAGEFKRAKSRELTVYLAMHPHGVGEAELDEALWPSESGRLVPPSTRDSTVSVARTALGGPERLLPAQGQGREKRYQLSNQVDSDFALFCRLHRHGRATGSLEALSRALGLVRGRPFEGIVSGRTFTWIHTEGHARHIESEVGDAADLAARLFLEQEQAHEARWAARQGLTADPLCERLWVRLMEAADQLGESQEVERLMDELNIALELGGDFSGLHPNTLAAYDRYRRGAGQRARSRR